MGVTMRDVAQRAGVSINTVSRVVNGYGEISETTRLRVLAAIDELGFRPNVLARSLVSGKSLSIALIIPQITDPFFPDVVLGVESIARENGYSVLLCNTNDDPQQELEYVEILASKQVDGIILCGSRLDAEQLSRVASMHRVAVLTSRNPRGAAVITINGTAGLFDITSYLIRLGHRKIGHLAAPIFTGTDRADGYRKALTEHGLIVDERRIVITPKASIEAGRDMARDFLQGTRDISALTCFNDLLAIGALQACRDLGIKVPDDLAIVGFDDIPLASLVIPPLTTMHVPRFALGEMVMNLLLRVITASAAHNGAYEERLSVEPQLVIRASCGGAGVRLPELQDKGEEVRTDIPRLS